MNKYLKKILLFFPPFKKLYTMKYDLLSNLAEKTKLYEDELHENNKVKTELQRLLSILRDHREEIHYLKYSFQQLSAWSDTVILNKWNNERRRDIICKAPFTEIQILENGEVYSCCPLYLRYGFHLGNVYQDKTFNEIWNSENAKKLRYSVMERDFEYCTKLCPHLNSKTNSYKDGYPIVRKNATTPRYKNYLDCSIEVSPLVISLDCDASCNLQCTSCRSHKKISSRKENKKMEDMLEKMVRPALKNCERLIALGSGEFFASNAIQNFYKTLSKEEFPTLKVDINTNAQLLTKQKWAEFGNLHSMLGRMGVSIDAAEKHTYETLRKGGRWEKLQEGLSVIQGLKRDNELELVRLRFIVQKLNYKQVSKFVEMAKDWGGDVVEFQRLTNWGTFTQEKFADMDVMDPRNPDYEEAKYLMEKVLDEKNIIIQQNVL